jgi:PAS domain S-box-containing protein
MKRQETAERADLKDRAVFRQTVEEILLPTVELDLDYNIVYANRHARSLLSLDNSDLDSGIHASSLVSAEQLNLVEKGLQALREGAEPTPITLNVVRKDGAEIPTETWAEVILEEGEPVGFVAYVLDLTRRMAIEERFQEKEGIFQFIVEYSSFAGIFVINDNYEFEYLNDKLLDMIGRTRSEVLGHDFREFLHPDSVDLVAERYIKRQRGEDVPRVYEFQIMHSDGTPRDVVISSSVMVTGDNSVKTFAQIQDITEEKQAQRALRESERKYRRLLETMDSGFCLDDDQGKAILVNDALCAMLGYSSPRDLIGKSISMWTYGWTMKEIREKIEERKKGEADHYEIQLLHRDGHIIPTIVHASPVFDAQGEYQGSFAIFTDVSELKNAEAEAKFLLDLLLHDIGNQLQLIVAGADLLNDGSDEEQITSARRYVLDGASRCLELIDNIRRAERFKSEPLRATDLVSSLKSQTRLFASQYNVTPEVEGLPPEVRVMADSALGHLFWNLMENGIKHNPNGDKKIWIHGESQDDLFELSFNDNGPGLNEKEKEDLFRPSRRSAGVGLHLVRRIVAKYGGRLKVDDRVEGHPEKGLSVRVLLRTAE